MLVEKPGEKRNADICPIQSMPTLTLEIAQELLDAVEDEYDSIDANEFDAIDDAAAKALAKHHGGWLFGGGLSLHGLRQFSEAAAEILSKHPSGFLRHREDGPAFTDAHGDRQWWFQGKDYHDAEKWAEAVLKSRNEPHDGHSVNDFLRRVLCKEDLI